MSNALPINIITSNQPPPLLVDIFKIFKERFLDTKSPPWCSARLAASIGDASHERPMLSMFRSICPETSGNGSLFQFSQFVVKCKCRTV